MPIWKIVKYFFFHLIVVKHVIRDFMSGFPEIYLVAQISENLYSKNKKYVEKYCNIQA